MHYESYDGDKVTRMVASQSSSMLCQATTRTLTSYNENDFVDLLTFYNRTQPVDIYLVYEEVNSDFYITDTIFENGQFNAVFGSNIILEDVTV